MYRNEAESMGLPKKTITQIKLAGNPGHFSREQLKVRAEEAKQSTMPAQCQRPRMPKHLSANAVVVWRQTVKLMRERGTLSADTAPTLAIYCEITARWICAKDDLLKRGLQIEQTRHDKQGNEYQVLVENPSLAIAQDAERQLLALQKALGITPDMRTRVLPTPESKASAAKPGTVAFMFPDLFKERK
jgi:P27 family predicted phage terminase small subunit